MFLCVSCHSKSTCRSSVHLNISRGKCESCGYVSDCFSCSPIALVYRRSVFGTIAAYRNVRQLPIYRKISM